MTVRGDTEIAERLSIPELVAVYRQAEADIRASFAVIKAALGRLDQTIAGEIGFHLFSRHGHHETDWSDPEGHLLHLRRQAWRKLLERMQIRKAMSIAAWKALEEQVENDEPPPITAENVEALVAQFRDDMPAMLEAAVHEVFDFLRPHHDRYKTNSQFEIGERVVLTNFVRRGYGRHWDVEYHHEQHLQALENVFGMLEGKMVDKTDGYYSRLSTAIKAIPVGEPCQGETDLFEFRGWKNQNLHLKMKRMDLVKKLNAAAGGKRLRPSTPETRP